MTTLEDKIENEQIIYQQYFNNNLLKNESKKRTSTILLICGIIIIVFEFFINLLLIAGIGAGLTFAECEEIDEKERKECEEYFRNKSYKLDDAYQFFKPCLIITCIILCLCFSYNKKIIIINCICIIIKLSLFIGYLINLQYTQDKNGFGLISFLFLPEITSDICLLVNEIVKFTIKN